MSNEDMKKCPYCAEMIKADAIKCRYCGSTVTRKNHESAVQPSAGYWSRINEGKRVAGVCTGLAHEFNAPKLILPLRLFFILTTIFYGFGFILYIVLWLLMPAPVDRPVRYTAAAPVAGAEVGGIPLAGYRKKIKPMDVLLGFLLLAIGTILVLAPMTRGHYLGLPLHLDFGFPRFIHDTLFFNINWITVSWPILIFLGLFLLFFGALKILRIFLGCGLIALGSLFLILFIPFLPRLLVFPGMLLIGVILLFVGVLKLAFGSTKVVKEETVSHNAVPDEEWNIGE